MMDDKHPLEIARARSGAALPGAVERIEWDPGPPLADYRVAMALADRHAEQRLGDNTLLSWYDHDRDFESPRHSSDCHQDSARPVMWTSVSTTGRN